MAQDSFILAKAVGSSLALAAASAVPGINGVSVPFLGVPLTALTMAAAGAVCSFAWQPGSTTRGRLFVVVTASTFVGAACVSVIPHLFNRQWPAELQPPLAFVFGLLAQWVVPATRVAIPGFFSGLSRMLVKMAAAKVNTGGADDEPQIYTPHNKRRTDDAED